LGSDCPVLYRAVGGCCFHENFNIVIDSLNQPWKKYFFSKRSILWVRARQI